MCNCRTGCLITPAARRQFLAAAMYCAGLFLALPSLANAATLSIGGTGADLGTMKLLAEAFVHRRVGVEVEVLPSLGSGGGIKAVIAGKIDIAISARPLKDDEQARGAEATPYARTALAIVTPKDNPATSISSAELIAIYAGERTHWEDGSLIRLVLRPEGESDVGILRDGIDGIDAAHAAALGRPGLPIAYNNQAAADIIQRARWGIGTSSLSVILGENRPLKALALDGVEPNSESIADARYPMAKTLYLVAGPSITRIAREFIAFVRSAEGARILSRTGHLVISDGTG